MRQRLREKLAKKDFDSPDNTSLILLSHVLGKEKSWVLAHSDYELKPTETNTLQTRLAQLLQGVPLPYILGQWEFYGRTFTVTPDVLIPRPETELLVEIAIKEASQMNSPVIVDVGTGSGAIAVSLAAELPTAMTIAVDISKPALKTAQENARRLLQHPILFVQANLLTSFDTQFDLICANLPYIPSRMLAGLTVVKWEPKLALDGGESGLDSIRLLLQQAHEQLSPSGVILLEIEASLGKAALQTARDIFPNAECRLIQDLAGRDRIIEIRN